LYEVRATNVEPSTIGRVPIVTYLRTPLDGWGRVFKRVFDLVGSVLGLLVLSPVFLLISIGIKLTSSGPIFFSQKRVTERKTFNCYKFRSMRVGANEQHQELMERHGVMFKLKEDPRVTRFGAYLRRSSLDELPQLWNVLRGEMSLVGPRPPMVEEVEHYSSWQRRRLHIKPGLTGLWQVSGRSDIPFDEWVRLDLTYIENWSIWLDITILLKTVWIVLKGKGAY
jgi:exopolysaccharide biosynthesis polyprenyl glycosylphosphotransferase